MSPFTSRHALALGVALGLIATAAGAQGGQTRGTSTNYRLGADKTQGRARVAPGLAVNPADARHLVAVDGDVGRRDCDHHVSRDGGRTWRSGHLRGPVGYAEHPCNGGAGFGNIDGGVAFGTGQRVYATFSARNAANEIFVLVATSTDGGATFGRAVETMPGYTYPKIAVQRRPQGDRIVVASDGGSPTAAFVTVSEDGGRTWSPPRRANTTTTTADEASQPAIGPDGTLYLAWRTADNGAQNFVVVGRSSDFGRTWTQTPAGPIDSAGSKFPQLAVGIRPGQVYVVIGQPPPAGSDGAVPRPGQVSGKDHFIPKDSDVTFFRSTDGAKTFAPQQRVNDDRFGNVITQRHPNISVARNGRIDIVWHDRRHGYNSPSDAHAGNGEPRIGDTYWSMSTDGGKTFSPNRRLTDRSINNDLGLDYKCCSYWSFGPVAVPLGDDALLVAWMDTRDGNADSENQDIYLNRVQVTGAGNPPIRRIAGQGIDAYSVQLSRLAYPAGGESILTGGFANAPATHVVVANATDVGSATAGAVLARAKLGPLLLSTASGLTPALKKEVTRLRPIGAYVLGDQNSLSDRVIADLAQAGVPEDKIVRLAGPAVDVAVRIADLLDRRTQTDKLPLVGKPAFSEAVIVNPRSADAGAAAGLAATLRLPVLLTDRDALPAATRDSLTRLGVSSTLVIGGPAAISEAVLAQLPKPTRLGGNGAAATSEVVARHALSRGFPVNVVYVADARRAVEAAALGAAVARLGGLFLLTAGADEQAARTVITRLTLTDRVDRYVTARAS